MFDSAEKMNDKTIKRFNTRSLDDFLNAEFATGSEYIHKIKLNEIELGSVVKPDHESTISQQVASDLNSAQGNVMYDWLLADKINDYSSSVKKIFNEGDPMQGTAFAKYHNEIPDGYEAMSAYSRWLKYDGIPFTSPFVNTMKNGMKKVLVDDAGLLTMKTKSGGQSVLVPNLPGYDRSLRNTSFAKEDGKREIYSYGQIEIADVNRAKLVNLKNLHIIKHNPAGKDILYTWDQIKDTPMGKKMNLVDRMSLSEVYKALSVNEGFEIGITSYRNPRTRPGDIIISGLKGFLDKDVGNQARVNAHDLKQRMEGDFDVDKINYWWDTPQSLMTRWKELSGEVGAVAAAKNPTSLRAGTDNALDFFNTGSIERYSSDQAVAGKMRGTIVKMSRILQFFDQYAGKEGDTQVIFKAADGKNRLVLDQEKFQKAKRKLAEDIQNIVDSKKGFDHLLYRDGKDGWSDKFLFGELGEQARYQGVFSWERQADANKNLWDRSNDSFRGDHEWIIAREAVNTLMGPYRGLLQIGAGIFEGGKRKKVAYDDLMEATSGFKRRMEYSNRSVYDRLLKEDNGIPVETLDRIFKKDGVMQDVFRNIVTNATEGDLLPFERVVNKLGANDATNISVETKMFGSKLEEFHKWSERYIENTDKDSQEFIKNILKDMNEDANNFNFMNYLEWDIKNLNKTLYEQKRNGNMAYAETLQDKVASQTKLKEELSASLHNSPEVIKMLIGQAEYRIRREITSQWSSPYNRAKQKFKSYDHALKWTNSTEGSRRILNLAKKEPIQIKGVSSTEQMDMIIWGELLNKFDNIFVGPDVVMPGKQAAIDLETDLYNFRKKSSGLWRELFEDKKRQTDKNTPWLDENMIMEELHSSFDAIYDKWETVKPGLGRLALLKVMSPQKDVGSMTYYNKRFLESYKSTSSTMVKFGLRWLSNTEKQPEMLKDAMFKNFAEQYNALYKTFKGLDGSPESFGHLQMEEQIRYNRENMYSNPAPLLDHKLQFQSDWSRTDAVGSVLADINPNIASTFGFNQSFSVGYMLSSRLVGPEWIGHAKAASQYDYTPNGYLPVDYDGGRLKSINGWDSYNDAKYNEARVFLGDALGRNILFVRHNPRVSGTFGENAGAGKEIPADARKSMERWENETETGVCP